MKHHQASAPTFVGKPYAKQVRSPVYPRIAGKFTHRCGQRRALLTWTTTFGAKRDMSHRQSLNLYLVHPHFYGERTMPNARCTN